MSNPAWDAHTKYIGGDVVSHAGADYIAQSQSIGKIPPAWPWEQIQSGTSVPLPADNTGATTAVVTPDPISGSGSMTIIEVPADCVVLGVKVTGDDFPRWVLGADPTDFAFVMLGDGTFDPTTNGASIGVNMVGGNAQVAINGHNGGVGLGGGNTKISGKGLLTAGLGVGNSAAATTPGNVVKKMEVFDASGASLGFVPVYDAIT